MDRKEDPKQHLKVAMAAAAGERGVTGARPELKVLLKPDPPDPMMSEGTVEAPVLSTVLLDPWPAVQLPGVLGVQRPVPNPKWRSTAAVMEAMATVDTLE